MQKLALVAATVLSTSFAPSIATASLVTFTYDDPAASITGTDYSNVLGFGVGVINRRAHAYMSLTFDTDTVPTQSNSETQLCSLSACGVTGTAHINGHVIPSSLQQEQRQSVAAIFNNGFLAQQNVMHQVFHTGNDTRADPYHAAHFTFNSVGTPNSPAQAAIFQNLKFERFNFERFGFLALQWFDVQTYLDGSQRNDLCGTTVCIGLSVEVRLFNSDKYTVTVSEVGVPEPSTIALIAMALLSMFGFGMMRSSIRRTEP
jgi:hypothetical protein